MGKLLENLHDIIKHVFSLCPLIFFSLTFINKKKDQPINSNDVVIKDYLYNVRCKITPDGKSYTSDGKLLGYINSDGSAGDENENFLGEITDDGKAINVDEKIVGFVDFEKGILKSKDGNILAKITPTGDIFDALDGRRGHVDPFSFTDLKIISSYIFLFDMAIAQPGLPSRIGNAPDSKIINEDQGSFEAPNGVRIIPTSSILLLDVNGLRAEITFDGVVKNMNGDIKGFINEDGSAGDEKNDFLGEITEDHKAVNVSGNILGHVNIDQGILYDPEQKELCTITKEGKINSSNIFKGTVDPYTTKIFLIVSSYILFFDKSLVNPGGPSLILPN